MSAYFSRDKFNKVADVHRKIIGHDVSVSENAMYEIVSSDAHDALTGHGDVLHHRTTDHYLTVEVFDADVLLTRHQSSDGVTFVVDTFFSTQRTEVCMPCDVYDLLYGVE